MQRLNKSFLQMQGVGSKLEEKYIIPVARELAIALKAIHAAGIIHRDVKGTFAVPAPSQPIPIIVTEA